MCALCHPVIARRRRSEPSSTKEAAECILGQGGIKPGPASGKVWLTPDKYAIGAEARAKLALNKTPDGYFEIPMCLRSRCAAFSARRLLAGLNPYHGQPGGGTEITTQFKVPVNGLRFTPFE